MNGYPKPMDFKFQYQNCLWRMWGGALFWNHRPSLVDIYDSQFLMSRRHRCPERSGEMAECHGNDGGFLHLRITEACF